MARLAPDSARAQELAPGPVPLRAHHLVGRAPGCDLRLADPRVSSRHAELRWTGSGWVVRDLGSRNGTVVDGVRLGSGEERAVAAGALLCFGHGEVGLRLVDAAAPAAFARSGEAVVDAVRGMLTLEGDADGTEAMVYRDSLGFWVAEQDGQTQVVEDGAAVTVGGREWTLGLPESLTGTVEADGVAPHLVELALDFGVSADEEYVELTLVQGPRRTTLKPRSHLYLLLTLARRRLEDAATEGMEASEAGWVHQEDLARMLAVPDSQVNLQVFRARKQLAKEAELADPAAIVERRSGTRMMRIGVGALTVRRL